MRTAAAGENSEPLLATPDAYYWLAGSQGNGPATTLAPSELLRLVSSLTGLSPAYTAWLLPALLASLLGPLSAIFCRMLGYSAAGLVAGLLATLAPVYLCRTGLGYYDTDFLLLSLPLVTALALLLFMGNKLTSVFFLPVVIGVAIAWMQHWHRLLPVSNAVMIFLALVLVWFRKKDVARVFYRLILFALCVCFSWPGIVLSCIFAFFLKKYPAVLYPKGQSKRVLLAVLCLLLAGLALFSSIGQEAESYLHRAQSKDLAATPLNGAGKGNADEIMPPAYPPMTATIAESERISYAHVLGLLHPWAGVALAGVCGFFWLVGRRPEALLLTPLLLFGLSAPFLGARVSMFAVPAVAMGVGVGGEAVLGRLPIMHHGRMTCWIVRALLSLVLCVPLVMRIPPPESVLSSPHAQALRKLGTLVPADTRPVSMIWTWWDFGYAASAFSGLHSFADPGRQGPEYVYFLSKVLGADSLHTASAVMHFSALNSFHPWEAFNRLGARKSQQLAGNFATIGQEVSDKARQFVVVSLDGLPLLPTIVDFSRWNLEQGASMGEPGFFKQLRGPVDIDLQHGRINAPLSETRLEVGRILLWKTQGTEYVFDADNPYCLVALPELENYFLVDRRLYQSNFMQLLLGNADSAQSLFQLVVNNAPYVRVYELVRP